jgi:hypothetical protein
MVPIPNCSEARTVMTYELRMRPKRSLSVAGAISPLVFLALPGTRVGENPKGLGVTMIVLV